MVGEGVSELFMVGRRKNLMGGGGVMDMILNIFFFALPRITLAHIILVIVCMGKGCHDIALYSRSQYAVV
jgi:hypothetical protein